MAYHPSYKQMGHLMVRETAYCKLNGNMVEGVGCPVLCARQCQGPWNSLSRSRLFGGSLKLMRWECKRIHKEVPFNRLPRTWNKYPRCQPPDICYQLCTPNGVHKYSINLYLFLFSSILNPVIRFDKFNSILSPLIWNKHCCVNNRIMFVELERMVRWTYITYSNCI